MPNLPIVTFSVSDKVNYRAVLGRVKMFEAASILGYKGKPLFEMCCYHMGIARKGGGSVKACQNGLEHFFPMFAWGRKG